MGIETKIEWTNRRLKNGTIVPGKTFNGWIGCEKVSPACANCYAERDALRRGWAQWGSEKVGGTRKLTSHSYWNQPYRWAREVTDQNARPLIFAFSLADVFEEWHGPIINDQGEIYYRMGDDPDTLGWKTIKSYQENKYIINGWQRVTMEDLRYRLFRLMADTSHALDWLILTKRTGAMLRDWNRWQDVYVNRLDQLDHDQYDPIRMAMAKHGKMPNVWAGCTLESQEYGWRLWNLLNVNAVRHFISAEPLLSRLDLNRIVVGDRGCGYLDALNGYHTNEIEPDDKEEKWFNLNSRLDWVITGGESGSKARTCPTEWYEQLRDDCKAANTAFFFKQFGEYCQSGDIPPDVNDQIQLGTLNIPDRVVKEGETFYHLGRWKTGRILGGEDWSQIPSSDPEIEGVLI